MQVTIRALRLLANWAKASETYWAMLPGRPDLGCYGTGYNGWGVQTNQKYVAAMAALATHEDAKAIVDREWALERALAGLRFSLHSHVTGKGTCTDGTQWGRTWISALGVERMMHAVQSLDPHLTDEDRQGINAMLVDQAQWLLETYSTDPGVVGALWNSTKKNKPESNLWNGAACWRAVVAQPDHLQADDWRELAHRFFINAVSVPGDAEDDTVVEGKSVRDRFSGANFFPNYALDHHGYLNVGYMVICTSNAAMLHYDLRRQNADVPQTLYHHHADLWKVLRRFIFDDGRLARIGGDSRTRYTYCQEFLLPSLVFAGEHLDEPVAMELLQRQIKWIEKEAQVSGGAFYSERLAQLLSQNLYYYTRLESDRACALAQVATYLPVAQIDADKQQRNVSDALVGSWHEPEHGAVMHRSRTRLASFAWRAHGLTQGLCLPPEDGALAEWSQNMGGRIVFQGQTVSAAKQISHRVLLSHDIREFTGGFLTWGQVREGAEVALEEGWKGKDQALHQLVFAALPDHQTVLGLQMARMSETCRGVLSEIKGMGLNVPNDLFNGYQRQLHAVGGSGLLVSPSPRDEVVLFDGRWVNIEHRLGAVGIYGGDEIAMHRSPRRRGGRFESLYVEEICWPCTVEPTCIDPGAVFLDTGWAVLASASAQQTRQFAQQAQAWINLPENVRGVIVNGLDMQTYLLAANFSDTVISVEIPEGRHATNLVTRDDVQGHVIIESGAAVLLRLI